MPKQRKLDILGMTQEDLRRFASNYLPSEIEQRLGRRMTQPELKRIFDSFPAEERISLMPPARVSITEQATLTLLDSGVSVSVSVQQEPAPRQRTRKRKQQDTTHILTVEEAAARLRMDRNELNKRLRNGSIYGIQGNGPGSKWRIPVWAIERFTRSDANGKAG